MYSSPRLVKYYHNIFSSFFMIKGSVYKFIRWLWTVNTFLWLGNKLYARVTYWNIILWFSLRYVTTTTLHKNTYEKRLQLTHVCNLNSTFEKFVSWLKNMRDMNLVKIVHIFSNKMLNIVNKLLWNIVIKEISYDIHI